MLLCRTFGAYFTNKSIPGLTAGPIGWRSFGPDFKFGDGLSRRARTAFPKPRKNGCALGDSKSALPVLPEERICLLMANHKIRNPQFLRKPLLLCLFLIAAASLSAADLADAIAGMQRHYASVETITGEFRQTYRAPGIHREESGSFWLKRPGLMRWEYRVPEEQLFVADGRQSYLYVPRDRQVTIQPFSAADLHNTPLEFLLGSGDINRSFMASWETEFKPKETGTFLIRLVPHRKEEGYAFLVLEMDPRTFDLRRIAIREPVGSTTEFFLSNVSTKVKVDKKLFQFKTPKGVEEIRLNVEQ
jgi:outer membrane lipoprotein carrier protein